MARGTSNGGQFVSNQDQVSDGLSQVGEVLGVPKKAR
jgi:hypothetical protein